MKARMKIEPTLVRALVGTLNNLVDLYCCAFREDIELIKGSRSNLLRGKRVVLALTGGVSVYRLQILPGS